MAQDTTMKRSRFICFHCRKMFRKTRLVANADCAECGAAMVKVGVWFEPPRHSDTKAWKQIEFRYTQKDHWFPGSNGRSKYYANIPKRLAQERQDEAAQRALCAGKGLKQRQESEKKQRRLASRSHKGRSLTNINDTPRYGT